jgi:hypothetical protein
VRAADRGEHGLRTSVGDIDQFRLPFRRQSTDERREPSTVVDKAPTAVDE